MNCQKCGEPDAHVHMTDIIDGEKRTRVLCERCAAESGFVIDPQLIQAATDQIQKIMAPLMASSGEVETTPAPDHPTSTCSHCGMTWPEFRKTNRFGCPRDYEVFSQGIDHILLEIQGHCRHRGAAPNTFEERSERHSRVESLREEMTAAVNAEDFECAARLRDEISALEAREGGDVAAS